MTETDRTTAATETGADEATEIAEALARNDRYLVEFVEALAICPYARACRETGRLARTVGLDGALTEDGLSAKLLQMDEETGPGVDVALLIFPRLRLSALDFDRLVRRALKNYTDEKRGSPGPLLPIFAVAFHPGFDMQLRNADVAVRFMRKSPDPTVQIVRPEAIERMVGTRNRDVVSQGVAEAGLRAVQALGAAQALALVSSFARRG